MSRKKAKKQIDIDLFKFQMKGIVCNTGEKVLDEAPDAYKNIQDIISMQDGLLVDVIDHFKPVIVVKG